jgi:glycine cleavage system regulatory protein
MKPTLLLIVLSIGWSGAQAHDARCDAAPFSVPAEKYPSLVRLLTNLFGSPKTEIISNVCNMKFNAADRTSLYRLGFKDEQINAADTAELVIDTIKALKQALDAPPAGGEKI